MKESEVKIYEKKKREAHHLIKDGRFRGTCSHCFGGVDGEGVEAVEKICNFVQKRLYHPRCFIEEYMPLFEKLKRYVVVQHVEVPPA